MDAALFLVLPLSFWGFLVSNSEFIFFLIMCLDINVLQRFSPARSDAIPRNLTLVMILLYKYRIGLPSGPAVESGSINGNTDSNLGVGGYYVPHGG